ncbi:MAG: glycosyltransferase family 2 protein, partial [Marinomonas gallaica]
MNHPIDVIVPVYRGLQDVIDCLDSIKASHNQQPYELILIEDCSPEPKVSALLRERAALGDYTLLVNEENLGFVATVNRGM